MDYLYQYILFFFQALTVVVAIIAVVAVVSGIALKNRLNGEGKGQIKIVSISQELKTLKQFAQEQLLPEKALKALRKQAKEEAKNSQRRQAERHVFVLDFNGSVDAAEVEGLRREITTVLQVAKPKDEVLVRLESGGGVVHGYGLAASQLMRIKQAGLALTVSVDKVAASGGYMMACVADKVIAAPFAIIGSIGVIAQLPNFNKLLKNHDIEFEQHTAGEFKRTLTVFGENTEDGRNKFKAELEDIHLMFKDFVSTHRSAVDIDAVATGEYWYGSRALGLNLVDQLQTSDEYLLAAVNDNEVVAVSYKEKKNIAERLGLVSESLLMRLASRLQQLWRQPF